MRTQPLDRLLHNIFGKVDTLSKEHEARTRERHPDKLRKKIDHMTEALAATNRKLDHMAADFGSHQSDKDGYQAA